LSGAPAPAPRQWPKAAPLYGAGGVAHAAVQHDVLADAGEAEKTPLFIILDKRSLRGFSNNCP
jgi:hypothetical protein